MENHFDGVTPEGKVMRCLARIPNLIQRKIAMVQDKTEDAQLLNDATSTYQELLEVLRETQERYTWVQTLMTDASPQSTPPFKAHAFYQRTYGICLAICLIMNFILSAIDVGNAQLSTEGAMFSKEVLVLAEAAAAYRPLGATYVSICLYAAWAVTDDPCLRSSIIDTLAEYQKDFPWAPRHKASLIDKLDWLDRKLRQQLLPDTRIADARTDEQFQIYPMEDTENVI